MMSKRQNWDISLFMGELRARFEVESQALQAENDMHRLKQRGQSAKDYIWKF